MVSVASNAFRCDLPLRTVASRAIRPSRHKDVRSLATLRRLMANVAIERFLRGRIDLVFGVIKICLRHPAIDQDRFRHCR